MNRYCDGSEMNKSSICQTLEDRNEHENVQTLSSRLYNVAYRRALVSLDYVRGRSVKSNLFIIITLVVDSCVSITRASRAALVKFLCCGWCFNWNWSKNWRWIEPCRRSFSKWGVVFQGGHTGRRLGMVWVIFKSCNINGEDGNGASSGVD